MNVRGSVSGVRHAPLRECVLFCQPHAYLPTGNTALRSIQETAKVGFLLEAALVKLTTAHNDSNKVNCSLFLAGSIRNHLAAGCGVRRPPPQPIASTGNGLGTIHYARRKDFEAEQPYIVSINFQPNWKAKQSVWAT